MVAHRQQRTFTFEEYLLLEDHSTEKSEFYDGHIYAMTGGSSRHALITGNVLGALWSKLRGNPCKPYSPDLKLWVPSANLSAYPDVSVYCGPVHHHAGRTDIGLNPTVIVEVLSPSTAQFDRNEKWVAYQQVDSLQAYVIVAQDQALVELHSRTNGGAWESRSVGGLDAVVVLDALKIDVALRDIYEGVDLV